MVQRAAMRRVRQLRQPRRSADKQTSLAGLGDDTDDADGARQASSSFLTVPTAVLTGPGLQLPELPLLDDIINGMLDHILGNGSTEGATRMFVRSLINDGDRETQSSFIPHVWTVLCTKVWKAPSWSRYALPIPILVLAAAVANHARRLLAPCCPWLGCAVVMPLAPDAAWRLVRARPDLFVADALGPGVDRQRRFGRLQWLLEAVFWPWLQRRVWDMVAGGGSVLVLAKTGVGRGRLQAKPYWAVIIAHTSASVLLLVWLCSCIEYAVDRLAHTAAWWHAAVKLGGWGSVRSLLTGPDVELFVASVHMVWFVAWAVVPLLQVAWTGARARQFGLAGSVVALVGALAVLLRFRSRLYLAIETGGAFVWCGYVMLGLILGRLGQREGHIKRQ